MDGAAPLVPSIESEDENCKAVCWPARTASFASKDRKNGSAAFAVFHEVDAETRDAVSVGDHSLVDSSEHDGFQKAEQSVALDVKANVYDLLWMGLGEERRL